MQIQNNDLVTRFTKGEVKAYNEMFKLFYHRIYIFSKGLVPDEDAKDVTADVFSRLWQLRHQLDNIQNIRAFLFASAKNACFNRIRDLKLRAEKEKDIALTAAKEEKLIILSEVESDIITRIKEEVDKLPENCREVFVLAFFEGYKIPEIAEKLSVSEKTVSNLKSLALKTIKTIFLNKNNMQLNVFLFLLFNDN